MTVMDTHDATAKAAQLLKEHRESIDRLDAILVFTLAERFKHTQAVGRLKAAHGLPLRTPAGRRSRSPGWWSCPRRPTSIPSSPRSSWPSSSRKSSSTTNANKPEGTEPWP
ncbi:Chorismate mutase I [Rubellimicrobium mesophilum DSM 19309]|uniref:chorismate mutase n=1 Tax=Rubellimicrobium mesophilum DSM 19309 TaxID=442562 RepID=A0A017HTZ2_9RHOB|nr:Chorismate mutase I [Rubellimicrobium mesophilum DSM 19309]